MRLPVKSCYAIAKLLKLVAEETKHYHAEREVAFAAWSDPRPPKPGEVGDEMREIRPEHMAAFTARMTELFELEVTIPWRPLDLATLGVPDFTPVEVFHLGPFAVMVDDPEPAP
jgi:hypothetical protein